MAGMIGWASVGVSVARPKTGARRADWYTQGRPVLSAPRTEPYGRNSRIRLSPWVFDAEAWRWPGMGYPGLGQPAICQPIHVCPCRSVPLAAPAQGVPPVR
jgi:hypothetical protein